MLAILKREIRSFFATPVGYLILGLFLIVCGLFLWVFNGPFNIFDHGFADLGNFFYLTPWVFLFLTAAITMKSFSEERKLGTLELLQIKPLSTWEIVIGKFLGILALMALALVPTVLYVWSISALGITEGNFDMGIVLASYLGMFLLTAVYGSIGLFASCLTDNQIVAFLVALTLCFLMYFGFESLSSLFQDGTMSVWVQQLGMKSHYESMGRGIVDTRDLMYFLGLSSFFLYLTVQCLKKGKNP